MYDGALIDRVIRIYHLRGGEAEEGIDGNENNANGITMNGTPPLEVMIRSDEEGGPGISFPKGGKRTVVGLMD